MPPTAQTLYRHWLMLRHVPRAPRKISTADIAHRLADEGCEVGVRTIQRDLHTLSGLFPLECDDKTKPFGWSWCRDGQALSLPAMDPHTALTLHLCHAFTSPLLPHATLRALADRFDTAQQVLDSLNEGRVTGWRDKVRVVSRSQPLQPPQVDPEVLATVYRGLFEERVLAVAYRKIGAIRSRKFQFHPLALVARECVLYLVGRVSGTERVIQLALHRMMEARQTARAVRRPDGWDLDAYIEAGEFGYRIGDEAARLVARVRGPLVSILQETPLADDQALTELEDGWLRVEATVPRTQKLRGWLLSYGSMVVVEEPAGLKDDLAAEASELASCYST